MTEPDWEHLSITYVACTALVYRDVAWTTDAHPAIAIDPQGIREDDIPVGLLTNALIDGVLNEKTDLDLAALDTIELVNGAYREAEDLGRLALAYALRMWGAVDPFRADAILHAIDHDPGPAAHTERYQAVAAKMAWACEVGLMQSFKFLTPEEQQHLRATRTLLYGVRPAKVPRYLAGPGSWGTP